MAGNYKYNVLMNGSGQQQLTIPQGMNYLSVINNTDNTIEVYQRRVTSSDTSNMLVKVPQYTSLTVPIESSRDFTVIYTDGGGAGTKKAEMIFSETNLNINTLLGTNVTGSVTIGADGVGLARQAQLPASLSGEGNLKVSLSETEGKTGEEVTSAGAGTVTVKATPGQVYALRAVSADITLIDNASNKWFVPAGSADVFSASPITCGTNIQLNFSVAGTAYIVYE